MAIELYSKSSCDYCVKAKNLLERNGKTYIEYKLGEDYTREILLSKFPEAKTFPVVVIDGYHVGGFEQLEKLINEEANNTQKILLEDPVYSGA